MKKLFALLLAVLCLTGCAAKQNEASPPAAPKVETTNYKLATVKEGTFRKTGKSTGYPVYTSEYATYANERIPTDRVALTGILHYGKADGEDYYIIKMRDEGDCQILH